jgi:hypothetical protein
MASDTLQKKGLIGSLADYAMHPFKNDMSLVNWFLFTGVIVVFIIIWASILKSIKDAAQVAG